MNRDLEHWLTTATRNLDGEAEERLRAEIEEHYEAALERQIDDGADALHAHRLALEALGDPELVYQALEEPYRSRHRYLRVAQASFVAPFVLFITVLITFVASPALMLSQSRAFELFGLALITGGLLTVCGMVGYSAYMLRRLLVRRFAFRGADLALGLLTAGPLLFSSFMVLSVMMLGWLFARYPNFREVPVPELDALAPLMTAVMVYGQLIGGLLCIVAGMLLLSIQIGGLQKTLYRTKRLVQTTALLAGGMIGLAVASEVINRATLFTLDLRGLQTVLIFGGLLSYLAFFGVLAEVFTRAAWFQGAGKPRKEA